MEIQGNACEWIGNISFSASSSDLTIDRRLFLVMTSRLFLYAAFSTFGYSPLGPTVDITSDQEDGENILAELGVTGKKLESMKSMS